jgi:hypothetical protein
MSKLNMTRERLVEIIEAYGASPANWPEAEREAVSDLLHRSPELRVLLSEAKSLDDVLVQLPLAEKPSDVLIERLMAARPRSLPVQAERSHRRAAGWRQFWPYGSLALPTGALACSMMLGLFLGTTMQTELAGATSAVSQADSDQLVALALAETNYPEEWKP